MEFFEKEVLVGCLFWETFWGGLMFRIIKVGRVGCRYIVLEY